MTLRVVIKGHSEAAYREGNAAEAITPGHMVTRGASDNIYKQTIAGGANTGVQAAVAIENHWFGGGLNDAYAANDQVAYQILQSGAEFQGIVAAGAPAIALHDFVECAGDGTIRKSTAAGKSLRARAALDNSAGGTTARLRVQVL
jgi:hypothetical protein